jgi:hypothetical protein
MHEGDFKLSYNLHCVKEKFFIKQEFLLLAWQKLVPQYRDEKIPRTLVEIFDDYGFSPQVNLQGDIVKARWTGEKSGYFVDEFLEEIAEFVEDGSFFRFVEEDGDILLRVFKNKTLEYSSQSFEDL